MNEQSGLSHYFLDVSRHKLIDQYWLRTCQCLDTLTEEQIWWRPHEHANSIGNLLLHLNGNIRQWILSPLGGIPTDRNRSSEFAEREHLPSRELRDKLDGTLQEVEALLKTIEPATLLQTYDIQNRNGVTGLEAIYHVVEHFSMHYGQILYITKLLTGSDLGFYRHLDGKK